MLNLEPFIRPQYYPLGGGGGLLLEFIKILLYLHALNIGISGADVLERTIINAHTSPLLKKVLQFIKTI